MLELLNQLDGFESSQTIKIIKVTNRIDILDPALLKIHSQKMNLMRGIDLRKIAEQMTGASGAETKAVGTEAGMLALRERRIHVTQEDFDMAVAKVMKKDIESNLVIRRAWK